MERDVPAIYATLIPFLGSLDTSEIRFVRGLQHREIILKGRWGIVKIPKNLNKSKPIPKQIPSKILQDRASPHEINNRSKEK